MEERKSNVFRKLIPYVLAIVGFIVIGYAYAPYTLSGKVVNQSDISSWKGMSHEIVDWNDAHPNDPTYWTNSMFSGMPATTISVKYHGDFTKYLYDVLFIGQRPASYLIVCMIGAFLMFLAFGVNIYLAILGAIAVAFCSYNMQIIQVGHNTKMMAIAFMPWVIAALVYAYRKGSYLGAALFGLALSFQVKANHPQITYYLAIIVAGYVIWQLIKAIKEKGFGKFFKISLVVLVAGLLGVAANINHLWPTYEYGKYTMRGGTELTDNSAATTGEKSRSGLDLEYATQWSYGVEETPNLLIPNFNGGASAGKLTSSSATYKLLTEQYNYPSYEAEKFLSQMPLYWGPQAFTAGPMYLGAICIFLFVLGLFVVKGGVKWWIVFVSLLAVVLSWGYHFMAPTRFFFNYMPLYNKFRTVSMILVILQVTVPILAILALDKFYTLEKAAAKKSLLWALGITGGFSLIFCLVPSLAGNFSGGADAQLPKELVATLTQDRAALLKADAFRSLAFILLAALVIWLSFNKKMKVCYATAALILLVGIDLWSADKRYLNSSHFVTQQEFTSVLNARPVDTFLKESDKDPNYRVLDLTVDPFNNAYISYHHKTIGGYSPAKLQRYQDLIDRYIRKEITQMGSELQGVTTLDEAASAIKYHPVLSMLNTRYIIVNGESAPIVNSYALGNCWFADSVAVVDNANEEIEKLGEIDPHSTAVVNKKFEGSLTAANGNKPKDNTDAAKDSENSGEVKMISLTSYAPNKLVYHYSTSKPSVALFSEVYYPGWKAVVKEADGKEKELDIFQANWVLRGAVVPAGEGDITFTFQPESFIKGEKYSLYASLLLLILINLICIIFSISLKEVKQRMKRHQKF